MKNKLAALLALAAVMAVSAASCGNDADDNTVPELPTLESVTEEATEETTAEETTEAEKKTEPVKTKAEKTTTEKSTEAETEAETEEKAEEKNEEPQDEPQDEPRDEPQDEPDTPDELTFSFDTLFNSADDIVAKLGAPSDVQEAPACFSNGADSKIYRYDGLEVQCYVLDGVENVCSVTITGNSYATSEGIRVGSSKSDVEAAYGSGEESGNYVIYYDGDKEMDVKFSSDTVEEIMFYAAV